MKITKVLLFLLFLVIGLPAYAQTPKNAQPKPQTEKVELLRADALEGGRFNGQEIRKLLGNVAFKQGDTYLYSDSAYQYVERNSMEAYGNVRINQGDSVTATANTVSYNGDTRTANMRGNVVLQDPRMTLTTPSLDYNLDRKSAFYKEGGTIIDGTNNLTSQTGEYNTETKVFNFKGNVVLTSADYIITTENLIYHTTTKIAYFNGPTTVQGKSGKVYAESGNYNTLTKVSNFRQNAKIETEKYMLGGDVLYYNENTKYGQATGNVTMTGKKDDMLITGQLARYWENTGRSVVSGSPVVRNISGNDTLFIAADTLISVESKDTTVASMIYAFHDVKIYKSDLAGKCDSLVYNQLDSVIYMFRRPILWSDKNQIVAKRIELRLRNKKIHTMHMLTDAFMVSEDTLRNYNQVKGRDMTAFFRDNKIKRVNVNGNSESIYFALEGDTALTGMNRALCSNMIIMFDSSRLKSISFIDRPDARFIPPHLLVEDERKLENFQWLIQEKPDRAMVLGPRLPKPKPKTTAKKPAAKKPALTRKQQKQPRKQAAPVKKTSKPPATKQ